MKTLLLQSLRAALATLLLLGVWFGMPEQARALAVPARMQLGVLVVVTMAVLFATLFRRVRGEDQIARLEAALCREQKARTQADEALAESDMLLERLTGGDTRRGNVDPLAQLVAIQSELLQVRRQYGQEDPLLASRIDLLCTRVDRVAQAIVAHATEPG